MAPKVANVYITGFCQSGLHEGEQHRNYRGEPLAFCRGQWVSSLHGQHTQHKCGCPCHVGITEIYEMAGRDRVWPETGKWWKANDPGVVPVEPFVRPWADPSRMSDTKALNSSSEVVVVTANQRAKEMEERGELTPNQMRILRAIRVGILPPNPDYVQSGPRRGGDMRQDKLVADGLKHMGLTLREGVDFGDDDQDAPNRELRAAGQLEREVKEVCDLYTIGLMPDVFQLTAGEIAKAINADNPPSTGAITNVLKRWHEVGFAVHATGPHRFDGYTPDGIELGVEGLYARKGRADRGTMLSAMHSFRRR